MKKIRYSVAVPCYNESLNIPFILERFKKAIDQRQDIELVLVDNGSTDGSNQVVKRLLPKYSFAKSIRVKKNIGYGHGILQGLKIAKGDILGWTHADQQTDPTDVIRAFEVAERADYSGRIFIKGRRTKRNALDSLFSLGMGLFASLYLTSNYYEINAQPTIFSRKLLDQWSNPPKDFSLDLYAYYQAKKNNFNVVRIPVLFPSRRHGKSSWNDSLLSRVKMIKRSISYIVSLKKGEQ